MNKESLFFSKLWQMVLYIALLVLTPFLMLQNYLQRAIGDLSRSGFNVGEYFIPNVLVIAVILLLTLLISVRKKMDLWRWGVLGVIIILFGIGQKLSDYYFNHAFYELQFNWHYFAYGIFAFIAFRLFRERGATDVQVIKWTFIMALCASIFDEFAQVFISSRIFDISDIGKDGWGAIIGLTFVFFMIEHGEIAKNGWKFRQEKLKDYSSSPLSMLLLQAVFVFFLLLNSSLFTDKIYWMRIIGLTILGFVLFFIVFHFSRIKFFKRLFLGLLIALIIGQSVFFFFNKDKGITHISNGLTIYKGFVIPFYDVMIFPNGTFRPVDKKSSFNARDLNTIFEMKPDILILGAGANGKGARGVIENFKEWDFVYNEHSLTGIQVFRLKNDRAVALFNRLTKEGKNVLFIIHTTE